MSASRTPADLAELNNRAASDRSTRLFLVVPSADKVARKKRVVLEEGKTLDIGKTPDCHVFLDDPSLEGAHVRIEQQGEEWTVQDLEGLGRCSLNGVRLRSRVRRLLRPMARLRIGNIECTAGVDVALDANMSTHQFAIQAVSAAGAAVGHIPTVRIAEGDRMGHGLMLVRGRTHLFGRGSAVDLFLEDPDVSRDHFSVTWQGDRVIVADRGSTGGTYLGSVRLEPHRAAVWSPTRMLVAGRTVLLLEPTSLELLPEITGPTSESEGPDSLAAERENLSSEAPSSTSSAPPGEGPSSAPPGEGPSSAPPGEGPSSVPAGEGPSSALVREDPSSAPAGEGPSSAPAGEGPSSAPSPSCEGVHGGSGTNPSSILVPERPSGAVGSNVQGSRVQVRWSDYEPSFKFAIVAVAVFVVLVLVAFIWVLVSTGELNDESPADRQVGVLGETVSPIRSLNAKRTAPAGRGGFRIPLRFTDSRH